MLNQARIRFMKPDIPDLKKKGYSMYDMHSHTKYSDGRRTVAQMMEHARKLGIGLAITDHNEVRGAVAACRNNLGIKVIPGTELTTGEGAHILFYFYDPKELEEYFNKYVLNYREKKCFVAFLKKDAATLVDEARQYNCVISAAHPYAISWTGLMKHINDDLNKRILKKIDAIEVINGSSTKYMNNKAVNLAIETDKCITGGSDAHLKSELGGVISYVKEKNSPQEFLDSILNKKNYVIGKQGPIIRKTASHCLKINTSGHMSKLAYIKRHIKFVREMRRAKKLNKKRL